MNGSAETRLHMCRRRWMKGVNKSGEKRTRVVNLVVLVPCSRFVNLVLFHFIMDGLSRRTASLFSSLLMLEVRSVTHGFAFFSLLVQDFSRHQAARVWSRQGRFQDRQQISAVRGNYKACSWLPLWLFFPLIYGWYFYNGCLDTSVIVPCYKFYIYTQRELEREERKWFELQGEPPSTHNALIKSRSTHRHKYTAVERKGWFVIQKNSTNSKPVVFPEQNNSKHGVKVAVRAILLICGCFFFLNVPFRCCRRIFQAPACGERASGPQPCSVQGAGFDKVTPPPVLLRSAHSWMCERQQARVYFASRSVWARTKSCGLAPSSRFLQRCGQCSFLFFPFLLRSRWWQISALVLLHITRDKGLELFVLFCLLSCFVLFFEKKDQLFAFFFISDLLPFQCQMTKPSRGFTLWATV